MMFLAVIAVQAQITIGGNVYGGGNAGETDGSTKVTLYGGTIKGGVFGGAKQASVKGSAFVHIDGEHMSGDIVVKAVYGGNDISGNVGTSTNLPSELTKATAVGVNDTYNAFVRTIKERTETTGTGENTQTTQPYSIFIGTLYGGGNGDYKYSETANTDGNYIAEEKQKDGTYKVVAISKTPFEKPVQDKVYLEIMGGTIAYLYGGGNNATVDVANEIYINNESEVTTNIQGEDPDNPGSTINLLTSAKWLESMGIASLGSNATRADYQFSRVFGGNNKAVMRIQPTWHLKNGKIENLYSGGNEGDMCSSSGLLLEIGKVNPDNSVMVSNITVKNVFGGCRKANVRPQSYDPETKQYVDVEAPKLIGYNFPAGFSARVLIRSGNITNVYGGNDISGHVSGGNAVGVYTSISGNIYGGGNGSYPYTDNSDLANTLNYGDYYYNPIEILDPDGLNEDANGDAIFEVDTESGKKTFTPLQSLEALSLHRPVAEQVSIRVKGTDANHPTIIGGAIYVGGSSATLRTTKENPIVELKVGSYVIADEVFLGNNGREMVSNEKPTDVLYIMNSDNYASFNLTDKKQFAAYMDAAAMSLKPKIVFDKQATEGADYIPYSTIFGSFYLGGNVGSMTYPGTNTMDFDVPIYIYNKIVGGCNDAYVPVKYALDFENPKTDGTFPETTTALNAVYEGGIRGSAAEQTNYTETVNNETKIKDRLILNFKNGVKGGVQIKPMRWKIDPATWNTTNKKYIKNSEGNYVLYVDLSTGLHELELNTVDEDGDPTLPFAKETYSTGQTSDADDLTRRFDGGNIYGGCHNSGYVNGNVVINLEEDLIDRDELFDEVQEDETGEPYYNNNNYTIKERRSGVILGQQGMDVLGKALNVFGGGKGKETQIWGSTTINLTKGYTFQIFGGSQEGIIGKPVTLGENETADYTFDGKSYNYNKDYSCTINVNGNVAGVSKISKNEDGTIQINNNPNMADCEFIYGGGFEGPICGNTCINLGNGRVFNTFAGSCNADILGHTETYIGRQCTKNTDGTYTIVDGGGFPWVRDYVYGANDLGGNIFGNGNFKDRVRDNNVLSKIYGYKAPDEVNNNPGNINPDVLNASAYIEYIQGRAEGIFGGCYGSYDYTTSKLAKYTYSQGESNIPSGKVAGDPREGSGFNKPHMDNAFVNFRPKDNLTDKKNIVNTIFGAGQGYSGEKDMDMMQESSYVLIDIPTGVGHFKDMEVFGAGAYGGLGMKKYVAPTATPNETEKAALDKESAIIDLVKGQIAAVYGASYKEGFTRRTVVNVPEGSTINIQKIFGGGYGVSHDAVCDAYESHVNFESEDARVSGNIYGGNNSARQTLYTQVNIKKPVYTGVVDDDGTRYMATIYGAGYGFETWANYTEVNLLEGAQVYEVYGGGEMGRVVNISTSKAMAIMNGSVLETLPGQYGSEPGLQGLKCPLAIERLDGKKHNTNVLIHSGAIVHNYAYGGGKGYETADYENGDVYGTTYIALLGGKVNKDIYAAGTIGAVLDKFGTYKDNSVDVDITDDYGEKFVASTTAYIIGGSVRNVYGGGWKGSVGKHRKLVNKKDENGDNVLDSNNQPIMVETDADINESAENDIPGETHVVIGIRKDQTTTKLQSAINAVLGDDTEQTVLDFYCGIPTVQRNAYGGGEGGAVYGKTHLTLNNGYIGYEYNTTTGEFEEKINDETYYEDEKYAGDNRLRDCGNVFGGGYDARSSVDESLVEMYGGVARGSVHGGGEIATIGRGTTKESGEANSERVFEKIYKRGKTRIEIFNGHVKRNVFGGGKGYNLLGYGSNSNLFTDGYTFGQTEVHIHGGKIGTEEGIADGYGNVFGGGDLGYVYSYGYDSDKTKEGKTNQVTTGSPGHYYYYAYSCKKAYGTYKVGDVINQETYDSLSAADKDNWEASLTEDCKVVIAPYLQIKDGGTKVGDLDAYDYVSTDYLNTLPKDKNSAGWTNLITKDDSGERGVQIYNAVFGGGNVASNSDSHYANATTVFGNTTATIYDVYHRDFVTVGTEHIGGIYGGGNLSVVDGYRELNITNYGTDYYNLQTKITIDQYHNDLSDRERAYFKLEYECQDDYQGAKKHYTKGEKISEEDYNNLPNSEKSYWAQYGFCSIYAGRLLNTIQRADFCGVYGSRMVLQGAKDRVASVGENIVYTINRVGELSLNMQNSQAGDTEAKDQTHGNYFGIYSIVNYLGNLTSDIRMKSDYVDKNEHTSETETYFSYKLHKKKAGSNWPNLGKSKNEVALASGVFLELTTENSTAEKKDYGYITGVVELDLINVKNEELEGGGFVYAKNEHRVAMFYADKKNVLLSEYNKGLTGANEAAKTYKRYRYSATYDDGPHKGESNQAEWADAGTGWWIEELESEGLAPYMELEMQTSGNFIHAKKHIVDDCYPTNNAYDHVKHADNLSPAHYWYIKGLVYVYDQVVSAYAGSASPYSKEVHLPLTITAASHGKLKLLNVKPNRYAYYYKADEKIGTGENEEDKIVWVNRQADGYKLNDVITWWDWQNLPDNEQALFVEETYVNAEACTIGTKKYAVGEYVMLPDEYDSYLTTAPDIKDYFGENFEDKDGNVLTGADLVKYVFRSSNNISHNTGYALTFDMNTPEVWNAYYTNVNDKNDVITRTEYEALLKAAEAEENPDAAISAIKDTYIEGPTFSHHDSEHPTLVLGKRNYTKDDIVTKAVFDAYTETADYDPTKMEPAYVATDEVSYTYGGISKTVNAGMAIPKSEYDWLGENQAEKQAAFASAWVCTTTLQLAEKNYLTYGELKTAQDIIDMKAIAGKLVTDTEIDNALTPAYICTVTGEYGGKNYYKDTYYSAIESWCNLSQTDRNNFTFNYDALNLLIDPDYSVDPTATTGSNTVEAIYHTPYSDEVGVEYKAVFNGYMENNVEVTTYNYTYKGTAKTVTKGNTIDNDVYENAVPNYKRFYTKVIADSDVDSDTGSFYIANDNFIFNGEPYAKGQVVSKSMYSESQNESSVIKYKVDEVPPAANSEWTGTFYYCYEAHTEGGTSIDVGATIDVDDYKALRDDQKYFTIQGMEPTENTTLYVSRESDVKDVTKEKIITVVYQYTYFETDDDGESESEDASLKLTNELHVINVHLQLESGAPTIGPLEEAPLVFPGDAVGLTPPKVTPGTYEVITNGWTLFKNKNDADHLRNGVPFNNNSDPVYWYQNQDHFVAFYSETYLGKTYSNYVKLNVANYHDLADIMVNHQDNHLYIDRSDVDRPCKIYINDYSGLKDTDARKDKNGLDELKNLFELSLLNPSEDDLENGLIKAGPFQGHAPLGNYVNGTAHLEFILRTDIDGSVPEGSPARTSIAAGTGDTDPCFGGNIHGDGHTISGLTQSLIGKLCGSVYNLGVTGSFTSAGVADKGEGFVENCWVMSDKTTMDAGVRAVFGNPSADEACTQIVNCYYLKTNAYNTTDNGHGIARPMSKEAFYNGEVAYNLNGFYLGKRYFDNNTSWKGSNTPLEYSYLKVNDLTPAEDGTASNRLSKAYYPTNFAYYQAEGTTLKPKLGYVESRFYDGDYRYANRTKPETADIRRRNVIEEVTDPLTSQTTDVEAVIFPPIWPDDYLFFGQVLNYGYAGSSDPVHQELPSIINRQNERVVTNKGNRVYRAPAYYRSSKMESVYFNSNAIFAKTKFEDASTIAHKGLTAIDFAGTNDVSSGYESGLVGDRFYPPLLDDDGITDFQTHDLTRNLLVYTGTETNTATKTNDKVGAVLHDASYTYTQKYNSQLVEYYDPHDIYGHWVRDGVAPNDHLLVDREDFNCPISYTFATGMQMWYQRKPDPTIFDDDNYVGLNSGWQSISIPFTAELVTTDEKGEITHFYSGSDESKDGKHAKIGHEYWLRECTDITKSGSDIATANFTYPNAVGTDVREVENTFLWDYYYEGNHGHQDNNGDTYQDADKTQYYSYTRNYTGYPLLTNGVPYIIGFPGKTYYEFDLSGEWAATSTGTTAPKPIGKQTITFVSAEGVTIGVSDTELERKPADEHNGYYFKPNYLNIEVKAPTETTDPNSYVMASDGGSYEKVASGKKSVSAFRTYFQADPKVVKAPTRSIVFSNISSQFGGEEQEPQDNVAESMEFSAKKHKIVVTSHMRSTTDVGIFNVSGLCIGTFNIDPGETIETPVNTSGVYIIRAAGGHYTKKVTIK